MSNSVTPAPRYKSGSGLCAFITAYIAGDAAEPWRLPSALCRVVNQLLPDRRVKVTTLSATNSFERSFTTLTQLSDPQIAQSTPGLSNTGEFVLTITDTALFELSFIHRHSTRDFPSVDPCVRVSIGIEAFGKTDDQVNTSLVATARNIACCFGRVPALYSGMIDIGHLSDTGSGTYLSPLPAKPLTWNQAVESLQWWSLPTHVRHRRLRQVCWGIYLSAPLAQRLDSAFPSNLCTAFPDGLQESDLLRTTDGGTLILCSLKPLDVLDVDRLPHTAEAARGSWLKERLRTQDLLF